MRGRWVIPVLVLAVCTAAPAQRPSAGEQRRTLDAAREKVLTYSSTLPDFICNEMVQRVESLGGAANTTTQKLTIQLSYFGQRETYKVVAIDGSRTDQSLESLGGFVSAGEFGSLLLRVFEASSKADFEWKRSSTVRKRKAVTYSYRVARATSHYVIGYRTDAGQNVETLAGYHGEVVLDSETLGVLRITAIADDIPKESEIVESSVEVDYDFADVAGKSYLLPARAQTGMIRSYRTLRNVVSFVGYRKFEAESTIDFGGHAGK